MQDNSPPTPNWPDVNPKQNFPEMEEETLKYWQSEKIFEESVSREPKHGEFVYFDGPPFATGLPHYGHILQGVIKDLVPRYKTMQGYRVPRRWGWDCHGLPVEYLVENELGLKGKFDIEDYGVDRYNEACRANVLRFADEWKTFVPRTGRWVDMENDYKTMNPEFMERVWGVFRRLWDKGLIYEGYKSMHISPALSTPLSNFEVGLNYKDITDYSATVKFKLVDEENTYFLAWTTTPWTLPGNVALAVGKDIEYWKVKFEKNYKDFKAGATYIACKEFFEAAITGAIGYTEGGGSGWGKRADAGLSDLDGESPIRLLRQKGSELVGLKYQPPFDYFTKREDFKACDKTWTVLAGDFVTTDSGTGIVHIASGFGEDDFLLSQAHDIPVLLHVDMQGRFLDDVVEWAGQEVKPGDDPAKMDRQIAAHLKEKGLLFRAENYRHSYPHCWRTDVPLINYATRSWFAAVEQIKEQLLANNQKVSWVPGHVKDGRFGKWLENARDWSISRNRYWGAPLPIWRCDTTGETVCVGTAAELKELSGATVTDLHKHYVDDITWANKKAADQKVKITFVRHGETDWNAKRKFQGRTNTSLNDAGRAQAVEKAKELSLDEYDVIISSPLARAKETAEIIASERKEEIKIDDLIIERSHGDWEGQRVQDVKDSLEKPEDMLATPPGTGESGAQVGQRVRAFVQKMQRDYPGKKILVVCHGGVIHAVRSTFKPEEYSFGEILPNLHTEELTVVPTFRRIPDVLDCWFESGSMPYAQDATALGEAAANPQPVPANFIAEAQDQTRGWFYTLHVLATALHNTPAFENCVTSGLILAEDGQKMSKSKKNYPDPTELIHKHGADAMRLYLMNSPVVRGEALRFSERGVEETLRGVLLPLWNTYYFFTTYARADGWTGGELPAEPGNKLDRWILSELNILIRDMTAGFDRYELQEGVRPLVGFMDALTKWYIRRSRRRFWKSESDTDKNEAYATLLHVLTTVSKLLAPVSPFIAETVYRGLTGEKSVHLAEWPEVDESRVDEKLSLETTLVRKIIGLTNEIRSRNNIRNRQPLNKILLGTTKSAMEKMSFEENKNLILEELNIKDIEIVDPWELGTESTKINFREVGKRFGPQTKEIAAAVAQGKSKQEDSKLIVELENENIELHTAEQEGDAPEFFYEFKPNNPENGASWPKASLVVELDTELTPELEREGTARDLVRVIQDLRKAADYQVSDRIQLVISGAEEVVAEWWDYICGETLAELVDAIDSPDQTGELEGVRIAIKKLT